MSDLSLAFRQIAVWIGQFLSMCQDHWLLQVALFLVVLDLIVGVLIVVRVVRIKRTVAVILLIMLP